MPIHTDNDFHYPFRRSSIHYKPTLLRIERFLSNDLVNLGITGELGRWPIKILSNSKSQVQTLSNSKQFQDFLSLLNWNSLNSE